MKKSLFLSAIVLAAFTAFIACSKSEIAVPAHEGESIELMFNAGSPNTRTEFGTNSGSGYPVTWSTSDEVIRLVEVLTPTAGEASSKAYASTGYALSNANATAMFSASVDALATEGTYDYYAIYPSAVYKSVNLSYSDIYVIIPESQTPTATSPDRAATVLYASSTGYSSQPTSVVNLSFSHVTAYGKMTVKNASSAFADPGETISSVSVSVPTGGIYYYWDDGHITAVPATKKDDVTIYTTNLDTSGDFVAWFACAPYSLAASEKLTVSVTTDANTYSRTITLSDALTFESGKVSKFSVDMSSAVAAGDLSGNYMVVSTDGTNPWRVMTNDASNTFYLGENTLVASSTVLDTDDASTNFSSFCVDTYVWNLTKVSGGYSMKNLHTNKYVSWSAGNTATAENAAATLVISDNGSGVFTVKHSSDESRVLQYNYNSGTNPRFAFYTSSQKALTFIPVSSYKIKLPTPTITNASSDGTTINVTWNAVDHADSYTVTCTGQTPKNIPYGTNTTSFTGLSNGNYTVTVTAVGSGDYVTSDAASEAVSVGSAINFSWTRSGSTNTVTDGYELTLTNAKSGTGYYQDKSSTVGLDIKITKSDDSAIFSSTPTTITLTAKVGGGSAKNPLTNNVLAYLIDSSGNNIAESETIVTTKVVNTTGDEYEVTIPNVPSAYGVRIVHEKETSYNVRLYSVSVSISQ